jgi:DAACS family dicarboxylate/amino acid:cation (Na+ or H+) symporter
MPLADRDEDGGALDPTPAEPKRRIPLHTKILWGLVLGAVAGLAANWAASRPIASGVADPRDADANGVDDRLDWLAVNVADPLGRVFLRLVLMVVVPLVFSALTLGVLELGDVRKLGRVGLRTLVYTMLLSSMAVAIGLTLVNVIRPGDSLPEEKRVSLERQYSEGAQKTKESADRKKSLKDVLLGMIPENPIQEAAGALDGSSKDNGMLSVMVFAVIFGVAMAIVPERTVALAQVLEGLFSVSMTIIGFAMRLAPLAVACLVFAITARQGFDIVVTLFWFVLTVLLGIGLQMFVVYPAAVYLLAKRNPIAFFRDISEAVLTAFGTSSSNATLPTALRVAADELHLPPEISQFVLTVGATGNQNGTALFEGVVVLFLAQVFGVELTLAQQLMVVLMSILAGVGTAGVPGGSLPLIVVLLTSIGVPAEGIGIILGVDRLLDMCRTTLNVSGDLVLATCVAQGEAKHTAAEPAS